MQNHYPRKHRSLWNHKPSLGQAIAGFTLLEVLVVISMLVFLGAMAAPAWLSFMNEQRLIAAQNQAFQAIRHAQREAIRHGREWEVNFREVNGTAQWTTHSSDTLANSRDWHNFNSQVYINTQETTLYQSEGIYRIRFTHKSRVNGQLGRITFSGQGADSAKRCVLVSTLLGTLRTARERSRPDGGGRYCY